MKVQKPQNSHNTYDVYTKDLKTRICKIKSYNKLVETLKNNDLDAYNDFVIFETNAFGDTVRVYK